MDYDVRFDLEHGCNTLVLQFPNGRCEEFPHRTATELLLTLCFAATPGTPNIRIAPTRQLRQRVLDEIEIMLAMLETHE